MYQIYPNWPTNKKCVRFRQLIQRLCCLKGVAWHKHGMIKMKTSWLGRTTDGRNRRDCQYQPTFVSLDCLFYYLEIRFKYTVPCLNMSKQYQPIFFCFPMLFDVLKMDQNGRLLQSGHERLSRCFWEIAGTCTRAGCNLAAGRDDLTVMFALWIAIYPGYPWNPCMAVILVQIMKFLQLDIFKVVFLKSRAWLS